MLNKFLEAVGLDLKTKEAQDGQRSPREFIPWEGVFFGQAPAISTAGQGTKIDVAGFPRLRIILGYLLAGYDRAPVKAGTLTIAFGGTIIVSGEITEAGMKKYLNAGELSGFPNEALEIVLTGDGALAIAKISCSLAIVQ